MDPITLGAGALAIGSTVIGALRRRKRLDERNVPALPAKTQLTAAHVATNSNTKAPDVAVSVAAPKPAAVATNDESKYEHNEIVAPAYPGLVAASRAVRQALLDVAAELRIPVAALATVIQSESEWDPGQPHDKNGKLPKGTPRAGLIQLTEGANLSGWNSAQRIWDLRSWPAEKQLREVVLPYFKRMKLDAVRNSAEPALALYKLNFLPGDAGKPDSYPLGLRGSKELVHPKAKITRGDVYNNNPVFHANGARDRFTWADVRNKIKTTEKTAGGSWVTLDGRLVAAPSPKVETRSETKTVNVPGKTNPTFAEGSSCSVAPALLALLREIDAAFPRRLKASDGLCGDKAHQERVSDHNTGSAIDFTHDPQNGPDLEALAALLIKDKRCKYVIWNKRIATPEIQGGAWRPYPTDPKNIGKVNPHTRHLHFSLREAAREDVSSWKVESLKGAPKAAATLDDTDKLLLDPVGAWRGGKVDNFQWVPLTIGEFRLEVAADCLAVNGVRLPVSFANVIAMCSKGQDMLPNTRAICDARWNQGEKRIVLRNRPPNNHGPDATLVRETKEWSAKIGPFSRSLFMGPWKEWVLDDVKKPGDATNYGLWGPDGKPIQTLGHRHNDLHVDDSQFFAPVRRSALRNGVKVDLLNELAKGCSVGGPLPQWLVEKLR